MSSYENLLAHIEAHDFKAKIMGIAAQEDACTVGCAVMRIEKKTFHRAFARMLIEVAKE